MKLITTSTDKNLSYTCTYWYHVERCTTGMPVHYSMKTGQFSPACI